MELFCQIDAANFFQTCHVLWQKNLAFMPREHLRFLNRACTDFFLARAGSLCYTFGMTTTEQLAEELHKFYRAAFKALAKDRIVTAPGFTVTRLEETQ